MFLPKIKFTLINKTFNLSKIFKFKDRQSNLHRFGLLVYSIKRDCGSTLLTPYIQDKVPEILSHVYVIMTHIPPLGKKLMYRNSW